MKRILLIFFILAVGVVTYAEPLPETPDVPQNVQSDDRDYLPNVIRQHTETEQTEQTEQAQPSDDHNYDEYVEEYDETPEVNQDKKDSTTEQKETTDKEVVPQNSNPINTDASKENVQSDSYVPVSDVSSTKHKKYKRIKRPKVKKKKVKRVKDGKPNFSKYQDAATDPYVQSIYEPTKTEEEKKLEEQESRPKTYNQDDYEQMYRDMQVPEFSFMHGIDPDQYYDMKDTTWSPYPLFRLNAPIYFKSITIEPGYYLLTPRKYKDNWYILFKEAGTVKYIIPVIAKDYTPANYYRDNLPELDMTKSQRWQIKFLNAWGKYIRKSKRNPGIKTNVELTDLDNNFILIDLYYSHYKYSCIFRVEKF